MSNSQQNNIAQISSSGKGGACYTTTTTPPQEQFCTNSLPTLELENGNYVANVGHQSSNVNIVIIEDTQFKCYNPNDEAYKNMNPTDPNYSATECCPNSKNNNINQLIPGTSNGTVNCADEQYTYDCTTNGCERVDNGRYITVSACEASCKLGCSGKELVYLSDSDKHLPKPTNGIKYGTDPGQVNPCDLTKQFVSVGTNKVPACAMINGWDCAMTNSPRDASNYPLGTPSACVQTENYTKGCRRIDSSLFTNEIGNGLRSGNFSIHAPNQDIVNAPLGVKVTGYSDIRPCMSDWLLGNTYNAYKGTYSTICPLTPGNFCQAGTFKNLRNTENEMYYKDIQNIKIGTNLNLNQGLKFELGSKNQNACDGWNTPDANGNYPYIPPASDGEILVFPTQGGAGNDGNLSCTDYCKNNTDHKICVDGYLALDDNLYTGGNTNNKYYQRPYWSGTTFTSNLDVGCDGTNVPMAPDRKQNRPDNIYRPFYKQVCRCKKK